MRLIYKTLFFKPLEPPPEYSEAVRTGIIPSNSQNASQQQQQQLEISMGPLISQTLLEQSTLIAKLEKQVDLQKEEIRQLKSHQDNIGYTYGIRRYSGLELCCGLFTFFVLFAFIRLLRTTH